MNPLLSFLFQFRIRGSARLHARYFSMLPCFRATWSLCISVVQHSVPISARPFPELMHQCELIFGESVSKTWLRPSPGRRPPADGACWVCWRSSSARAAHVCYQRLLCRLKSNNKAKIRNRDLYLTCLDLRLTRSYFWQPSKLHHDQIIVKARSFWKLPANLLWRENLVMRVLNMNLVHCIML